MNEFKCLTTHTHRFERREGEDIDVRKDPASKMPKKEKVNQGRKRKETKTGGRRKEKKGIRKKDE